MTNAAESTLHRVYRRRSINVIRLLTRARTGSGSSGMLCSRRMVGTDVAVRVELVPAVPAVAAETVAEGLTTIWLLWISAGPVASWSPRSYGELGRAEAAVTWRSHGFAAATWRPRGLLVRCARSCGGTSRRCGSARW